MPLDNKLELVVEVDVNRANASIKSVNAGLSSMEATAVKAARGASSGIDGLTVSVAKGAAAAGVLASAFERVVGWVKTQIEETSRLRRETRLWLSSTRSSPAPTAATRAQPEIRSCQRAGP